ncbi:MAG: trimethylamine methyltransferase family protein [Deltaproteobacteria bacterium]|nr:trimethylamine methyltransferase family protein [Deltaproteobacteria bacterium]
MNWAEFLTAQEVERVHEASLSILEETGILVRNEKARKIFAQAGCRVEGETGVVKIPGKVVEAYSKAFPHSFTFRGRDPRYDRTIPEEGPIMITASSAPDIIDPETGERRRATAGDIARIAALVNELPGYDVFSISTLAADAPPGLGSVARFYPALKNCLKPVRSNTPNMRELQEVLELGALIAGGEEAYRERPLINHHYCPVVSPLTMDVESTEAVIHLTGKGLPVYGTICPNAGMSSPLSLLATLAQGNAEFLALAVLMQMIKSGAPLIYAVLATVADMRTGNYAPGGIETAMLQIGFSQMARRYRVPSGGYIGLTNAHMNDAQSGYETGMGTTAALLGGADMLNMGGLLGSLMVFDFAKAMIDHEIAMMLKQLRRGIRFQPDDLCLGLIGEVGPGGTFMDQIHTLEKMRTTAYLPKIATREMGERWEQEGRAEIGSRALKEAKRMWAPKGPALFGAELDRKILSRFPGLGSVADSGAQGRHLKG